MHEEMIMVIKSRPVTAALAVIVLASLLMSWGCSPGGITTAPEIKQYQFKRLLLLPIKNSSDVHGKGETVHCALCGTVYTIGTVENGAEEFITDRLNFMLDGWTPHTLIPSDQYQALRSRILSSKRESVTERELLAAVGREYNADAVLTGSVYRFKNRVGSDFAVESPASVGFDLDLIETQSGGLLWSRRHEETQQALSENLFGLGDFFMRKGKWVTVEDLAISGLEKALQTIPIRKEKN